MAARIGRINNIDWTGRSIDDILSMTAVRPSSVATQSLGISRPYFTSREIPNSFGGCMPNVSLAAGFRMAALIAISWIINTPVAGQAFSDNLYDASRTMGYSARGLRELAERSMVPDSWGHAP